MSTRYDKLSKKTVIKLSIFAIIVLIFFILGIMFFVRLFTLNKIYKRLNKDMEADNYNIKAITYVDDKSYKTYTCYKNGIAKFVSGDGRFTWMYKDYVFEVDQEAKIVEEVDPTKVDSFEYVDRNLISSLYIGYNFSFLKKLAFVANLKNEIGTFVNDDVKYYEITEETDTYKKGVYINKYTNKIVRSELWIKNNNQYFITEYEVGFGNTTTAEVQFIDTTGFTFYNKDGEVAENPLLFK